MTSCKERVANKTPWITITTTIPSVSRIVGKRSLEKSGSIENGYARVSQKDNSMQIRVKHSVSYLNTHCDLKINCTMTYRLQMQQDFS